MAMKLVQEQPLLFQKVWRHGENKDEDEAWFENRTAFENKFGSEFLSIDDPQYYFEYIVGLFFMWNNRSQHGRSVGREAWPTAHLESIIVPLKTPWIKAMATVLHAGVMNHDIPAGRNNAILCKWYSQVDFRPLTEPVVLPVTSSTIGSAEFRPSSKPARAKMSSRSSTTVSAVTRTHPSSKSARTKIASTSSTTSSRTEAYSIAFDYINKHSNQFEPVWPPVHQDDSKDYAWETAIETYQAEFADGLSGKDALKESLDARSEVRFKVPNTRHSLWEDFQQGSDFLIVSLFLFINRPPEYELVPDGMLLQLKAEVTKKQKSALTEKLDPVCKEDKLSRWYPQAFLREESTEDEDMLDIEKDGSDDEKMEDHSEQEPERKSDQEMDEFEGSDGADSDSNVNKDTKEKGDGVNHDSEEEEKDSGYVSAGVEVDLKHVPQCKPCISKKQGRCSRKWHGDPCDNCLKKAGYDWAKAAENCVLKPLFGEEGSERTRDCYGSSMEKMVHKSDYAPFGWA